MLAAVVPVQNEEKSLKKVFHTLKEVPIDLLIPVINGSTDSSQRIVTQTRNMLVSPFCFKEPLGIDVPRAVGAKIARDMGATEVLFLDGDMGGDIVANLQDLVVPVKSGLADMVLTDCYPGKYKEGLSPLANDVLEIRRRLNCKIGLEQAIGTASPSHGPHVVSRRFLLSIPLREIATPPVSLALAVKGGLTIEVGTTVPHKALGSPGKDPLHSELIAHTIIGDCLEALHVYMGQERHRSLGGFEYTGYHSQRRYDLLDQFLEQHQTMHP